MGVGVGSKKPRNLPDGSIWIGTKLFYLLKSRTTGWIDAELKELTSVLKGTTLVGMWVGWVPEPQLSGVYSESVSYLTGLL